VLELGGNAGIIIDRSADLSSIVHRNVMGAFGYAGQVCIKVQRIFVHESLFHEYQERFVDAAARIGVGDPRKEDTVVGPVIDDQAADRIESWIREAVQEGASLLTGGGRDGRVIAPTVLTDVADSLRVVSQEVFGPVVTLHRFSTIEEAVEGVNRSSYGLQAGIFSNDFRNILYAYEHLQVGGVIVNDNSTYRIDHMPYGGVKDSGFGREGLRYAIEEMTEPRLLAIHRG
jgi:glyceraldehyde-3-phosphate dehydrogenase (NADP+)